MKKILDRRGMGKTTDWLDFEKGPRGKFWTRYVSSCRLTHRDQVGRDKSHAREGFCVVYRSRAPVIIPRLLCRYWGVDVRLRCIECTSIVIRFLVRLRLQQHTRTASCCQSTVCAEAVNAHLVSFAVAVQYWNSPHGGCGCGWCCYTRWWLP